MGRGSNWTGDDDVEMCKAWLHVSTDSVVGNNQKFTVMWNKIVALMKKNMKENYVERSLRAAQCRFALVNAASAKFAAAHAKAQRSAPSGTNLVDMERRAMEIYRLEHRQQKSFEHKECWLVLRQNPKWQAPTTSTPAHPLSSATTEEASSPEILLNRTPSAAHSASPVATPRPVGAKRAKSDIQLSKDNDRAIKAMEVANRLATKRQRIMQDQMALAYCTTPDEAVAPAYRAIFERRRAKVLKELDEEDGPASPIAAVNSPLRQDDEQAYAHEADAATNGAEFVPTHSGDDEELRCYGDELPTDNMSFRTFSDLMEEEMPPRDDIAPPRNRILQEFDLTLNF